MDGACRHVSAALYELESFDPKSVTDGENKWLKRARSHDCPVPIKSLRLVKAKYSILNEVKENNVDSFDPRMVADRSEIDIAEITKQLKQVQPDNQALDVLDENIDQDEDQNNVHSSCLEYSVREHIKSFCTNLESSYETQAANKFIDKMGQYNQSTVNDIEKFTRGQNQNPNWKAMRYGMLTASNFKKVCESVDKDRCAPSLIKSLLSKYPDCIEVPALQWGRKRKW